jgi:hypothetical protein
MHAHHTPLHCPTHPQQVNRRLGDDFLLLDSPLAHDDGHEARPFPLRCATASPRLPGSHRVLHLARGSSFTRQHEEEEQEDEGGFWAAESLGSTPGSAAWQHNRASMDADTLINRILSSRWGPRMLTWQCQCLKPRAQRWYQTGQLGMTLHHLPAASADAAPHPPAPRRVMQLTRSWSWPPAP